MPGKQQQRRKQAARRAANRTASRRVPTSRPAVRRSTATRPAVRWMAGVLVLGLGAALIVALAAGGASSPQSSTTAPIAAGGAPCAADSRTEPGRSHVATPVYKVNPPAGGDHLSVAARAGQYTAGNVPPDGNLVHSLEHGYVDIWYQPSLPAIQLAGLQAVAGQFSADVLLVPRPSLPVPVAATAWHKRLLCQGVNTASLTSFVETWRNQGPEKIPH